MRVMARVPGVLDGIMRCTDCNAPLVKVGKEYGCPSELEPEELVAVGFLPMKDAAGNRTFTYESTTKDQQQMQISQAISRTVEVDNAHLQAMGLDLEKIRKYQIKHNLLP